MRYIVVTALFLISSHLLIAQTGIIAAPEIYGNRSVPTDQILFALGMREGDTLYDRNADLKELEKRVRQVQGIKQVSLNSVCCNKNGKLLLYVGIGETDSVKQYRSQPVQHINLPAEMMKSYNDFLTHLDSAVRKGQNGEYDSLPYSLVKYTPVRNEQMKFIKFANQQFEALDNVLKNAADDDQRAAAAQIIAYGDDKKKVVKALLYAIDDPNDVVRNNAIRALGILVGYNNIYPRSGINIPADPFIEMLNSLEWTDRNKASILLFQLTENRDKVILDKLNKMAYSSLLEMAKWKDRGHALFPFLILGRIAGIPDELLFEQNFSEGYEKKLDEITSKIAASS